MSLALQTTAWGGLTIRVAFLAVLIPGAALALGYGFLKMLAHMQSRLGPMEAGPHGVLQLIADGIKFIQKEDIIPTAADKPVFALAPGVVLVSTFMVFMTLVFGPTLGIIDVDTQVFITMAVGSISVIGILMAGWASANKYSAMGGIRAAGQLIAYELPLVLAIVGVVMLAGSMNLHAIVDAQANFKIGPVPVPFVVPQFLGFVTFLIASQAEMAQAPFDMPVAESELVSGYGTEYSGFRYLFFFVAEFASNFALAAIAATLFLGGYWVPWVPDDVLKVVGPLVLGAKVLVLVFFFFWMRATYPRLREDQLQKLAWKVLIPLMLANILVTGVAKVVF